MHVVDDCAAGRDAEGLEPLVRLRGGGRLLPLGVGEDAPIATDRVLPVACVAVPVALREHRMRGVLRKDAADLVQDGLRLRETSRRAVAVRDRPERRRMR